MLNSKKYRVPFITAIWMIAVPLTFAFFAGAGEGTVFAGLAHFLGVLFGAFGGASFILGAVLLVWVLWRVWRDGASDPAHG